MNLRKAYQCTLWCVERFQKMRPGQAGAADKHCMSIGSVESSMMLTETCSRDLQQKQVQH